MSQKSTVLNRCGAVVRSSCGKIIEPVQFWLSDGEADVCWHVCKSLQYPWNVIRSRPSETLKSINNFIPYIYPGRPTVLYKKKGYRQWLSFIRICLLAAILHYQMGWIYKRHFHIYWQILVKFRISDLHIMPFIIYEFRENWHSESQALLRGLYELVSVLSIFLARYTWNIDVEISFHIYCRAMCR